MSRVRVSQLTDDWPSVLHSITGEAVSSKIERQAIAAISRDFEQEERREAEMIRAWTRMSGPARALRRDAARGDDRIAKAQAPLRVALKQWRAQKPVIAKAQRAEEASVAAGSVSATLVPPYTFEWTNSKAGGPAVVSQHARKSDGFLMADVGPPDNEDAYWGRAWAAVGIFFKPAFTGTLQFSSTPGPIFPWYYTIVSNASARSGGKVGLRVYQFVNGKQNPPDSYLIQHSVYLWNFNDDAGLFEVGGEGPYEDPFNPALTLKVNVSKDAAYNLWVYFKTGASADGGDLVSQSGAQAEMNGIVPSMTWALSL